jgi:ethanolamine ammonia-lyase large subunit
MKRKEFIKLSGLMGTSVLLLNGCNLFTPGDEVLKTGQRNVSIKSIKEGQDIFSYIQEIHGVYDQTLNRQILGAANDYKEGDETLHVAAANNQSRLLARKLLGNTKIRDLNAHKSIKMISKN